MTELIVKQPNGKHALFNSEHNTFLMINCSVDEIKDRLIEKEKARINSDIVRFYNNRAHEIENDNDQFFQYAFSCIEEAGLLEDMKEDLKTMGFSA